MSFDPTMLLMFFLPLLGLLPFVFICASKKPRPPPEVVKHAPSPGPGQIDSFPARIDAAPRKHHEFLHRSKSAPPPPASTVVPPLKTAIPSSNGIVRQLTATWADSPQYLEMGHAEEPYWFDTKPSQSKWKMTFEKWIGTETEKTAEAPTENGDAEPIFHLYSSKKFKEDREDGRERSEATLAGLSHREVDGVPMSSSSLPSRPTVPLITHHENFIWMNAPFHLNNIYYIELSNPTKSNQTWRVHGTGVVGTPFAGTLYPDSSIFIEVAPVHPIPDEEHRAGHHLTIESVLTPSGATSVYLPSWFNFGAKIATKTIGICYNP